ncbi:tumor protein p53-inducible nuclear protein 1 [Eucyclogobius newberryi]|uniref:tumor protein p53-inducible nuclear protein 1 n=1 Tax=Eucyclogobius newberryi TaxID=166745 RepID=UPI003B59CBD2
MLGRILSHLMGNAVDELEAARETVAEMMEFEEGGWVIVNLPEGGLLTVPEADPLENLLIEHPSMSVYQIRHRVSGAEEEEEEEEAGSEEEEDEDFPRPPVAVTTHLSWRLAAWGVPLPCNIQLLQGAKAQAERKKVSRGALRRQNMAKTRFCASERRFGHFKQPSQRLYNY